MKKIIFLTILLLLFATKIFAQDNTIDSLKIALKIAKNDTTRCNVLSAMIEEEGDDKIWVLYNEQLKRICEKNLKLKYIQKPAKHFYLKQLGHTINNTAYLMQQKGDISNALNQYYRSLKILEEIKDRKGVATSLNNIGMLYDDQGNIPKALEYYNKSWKIQEEINDMEGMSSSINNIGFIYHNQGDISKAIEYYFKSLKINEEINDKAGIAIALSNIGQIYQNQGDVNKAKEYFLKSLKIHEALNDKEGTAISLNAIGVLYLKQTDYIQALKYFYQCLKIYEGIKNKKGAAISLHNIGFVFYKKGDFTAAILNYEKSLKLYQEIGHKEGVSDCLSLFGTIYLKTKDYRKAEGYGIQSMQLAKELGYPEKIRIAADLLYQIYKNQRSGMKALEFYEIYTLMKDSINNEATQKASVKKQMQYEYGKKAAADSVKVAEEKKIVAVQFKQEKTQRFALYGGLGLVMLFAGFIFNRFRVTQKQKNIIELKEKETQYQKHIIEEKHKEITDSINYAERIQRSFLATTELLDENLKNYFVFFKPKDVVSGDFYWASKLNNNNFALVIADSTGHGVPGAIMSLLNVTSLEKAIEHHTNPAEILNHTRQTIIERLKKDGSVDGGKDGMDCSFLAFDFSNNQLHVSAANNPVWMIRENELIEIKPDKMPVGKGERQQESFTLHTVELQTGDTIYALTDGFPDQFGGPKGKKFMSKKLKELLLANVHLSIAQQKELLDSTFKKWVGDLEQVDDVTVIGIRV